MKIPEKYYQSVTVNNDFNYYTPSKEKLVSCGILHKETSFQKTQHNLKLNYYSGVYILNGTGTYTNNETQRTYLLYPGCFIQRLPGISFNTDIDLNSDWLEFYININEDIFNASADLGIFSREPILYIGENYYLFDEFLNHMEEYKFKPTSNYPILMFEACSLLYRINQLNNKLLDDFDMLDILNHLERNLNIGISIVTIAEKLGMDYNILRKKFKKKYQISISSYIIKRRTEGIKRMITENRPIKEIAAHYNYCDEFALIKQFKKQTGLTPRQYRLQINQKKSDQAES